MDENERMAREALGGAARDLLGASYERVVGRVAGTLDVAAMVERGRVVAQLRASVGKMSEQADTTLRYLASTRAAVHYASTVLAAEADALEGGANGSHSLPIVSTCGDCGWCCDTGTEEYGIFCASPKADAAPCGVDPGAKPPDWCPLRAR